MQSSYDKINEVNVYCGSYLPDWRPGKDFRTLYSADPGRGGGVHLDLFHELDYLVWIFGQPIKHNGTFRNVSSLNINAIDYANYVLCYPASVILNYYRRKAKRVMEIVFSDKTWIVDLLKNEIRDENEILIFASEFEIMDTYKKQMSDFIEGLKSNSPLNTLKESVEILKICLNNE